MTRPALAWLGRHTRAAALVAVGILGGGAALAIGSVPDGSGTIHGCVVMQTNGNTTVPQTDGSNFRVIDPDAGQNCAENEKALNFNQTGPAGPAGPAGAPGAQGPQGPAGAAGDGAGGGGGGGAPNQIALYLSNSTDPIKLSPPKAQAASRHVQRHGGDSPVIGPLTVSSFSFGASNALQTGHAGGGANAGKASLAPFDVTRRPDENSPGLFLTMAKGEHYKQVVVAFFRMGARHQLQPYLTFRFSLVFVTSLNEDSSGETPVEKLEMAFSAAQMTYTPQNKDGSYGTPVTTAWNGNGDSINVPGN